MRIKGETDIGMMIMAVTCTEVLGQGLNSCVTVQKKKNGCSRSRGKRGTRIATGSREDREPGPAE